MKELLEANIQQIHTTELGLIRIQKGIGFNPKECINMIREIISYQDTIVEKIGKNFYVYYNNMIITINSYNFCVITAKRGK